MDKIDRLLRSLPHDEPGSGLPLRILATVHRRHIRRRRLRLTLAAGFALGGLWLVSPAAAWLINGDLFSSGAPWLTGGADYLSMQSVQILATLWNGMLELQRGLGSSLVVSLWAGSLLLGIALLFVLDIRLIQPSGNGRSVGEA